MTYAQSDTKSRRLQDPPIPKNVHTRLFTRLENNLILSYIPIFVIVVLFVSMDDGWQQTLLVPRKVLFNAFTGRAAAAIVR